jgi:hypothetical protein
MLSSELSEVLPDSFSSVSAPSV